MIYALQKQFCSWWASAASKLTPARCGRREAMGAVRGLWKLPGSRASRPRVLPGSPTLTPHTHPHSSFEGLGFWPFPARRWLLILKPKHCDRHCVAQEALICPVVRALHPSRYARPNCRHSLRWPLRDLEAFIPSLVRQDSPSV